MPSKMYNRARMTVTSTGTGALSLGIAVAGYQTFSSAGAQNNDTVSYTIEDGLNWEIGTGTFNATSGTLSRTVTQSYNGTSYGTTAISVTTNAQVYITALAADIVVTGGPLGTPSSATLTNGTGLPLATGVTGTLPVANGGTGLTSLTAGRIPYGNGTSAFGNSANLLFDGNNLGIGGSPSAILHLTGGGDIGPRITKTGQSDWIMQVLDSGALRLYSYTASSERMRLDASGNLGLGVVPSAWNTITAFQVKNAAYGGYANNAYITANAYYAAGGSWKYLGSDYANAYMMQSGQHQWYNASSGAAAGTISFTQAMTLDASGNVGIGTSSPGTRLDVLGGTGDIITVRDGTNANLLLGTNASGPYVFVPTSAALRFGTGNTERARIDSSGNLQIGKTSGNYTGNGIILQPSGYGAFTLAGSTNATDTLNVYSTGASAYRFYVGMAGTIYATSTTITAISDRRLKENITDLDIGLNALLSLKPRKFDWKDGKGKDIKGDRGWIADEFAQVFPDLIDEWKDTPPEGEEPYKSVRPDLMPVVVKAIQELAAKVTALEAANG